jgi:hypothetical protein
VTFGTITTGKCVSNPIGAEVFVLE